jgi:beta-glucosidase-like glycosyl hydrolase
VDNKISKTKESIENLCDEIIDLEENEVEFIHYPEETEEKIDDAKEKLARAEARLTRFERSKASVNERGYCMAIPTLWNDRSRTEKSKNITNVDHNEETAAPDKAVRRDIKNYVTVLKRDYQETPNASLLQIFGAFRNLYRKNVKRNNDYASQKTDRFFMRELQEQLDIRDGSKTAEVTSPMGHNKG